MTSNHELTDPTKWDVALEAMAREESKSLARELQIDDFLRLAKEHTIRFDDIMVTMFEVVLHGKWSYFNNDKTPQEISGDEVNNLYVGGRLKNEDVKEYDGYWKPN